MLVQGPNNKLLRSSETGFKTFLNTENVLQNWQSIQKMILHFKVLFILI